MDYGERQDRAKFLVKQLRGMAAVDPTKVLHKDWRGVPYTASDMADAIENHTDVGTATVAVAGLVFLAMGATPEFVLRKP